MKFVLAIAFIIILLVFVIIHFVVPRKFVQPIQKGIPKMIPEKGIQYEKIKVSTNDSNYISGYHVSPKIVSSKNDTVLIILHGISGAKEKFLCVANYISRVGYRSYVLDLRMHGESTGESFTYGQEEKKDISKVIDYILNENSNYTIGLMGHSMGGAITAQTLEYDKRLSFGVIQSSFRDLNEIVHDYSERLTKGLAPKVAVDHVLRRAGVIANFDPFKISPLNSISNVTVPLLISHGEIDDKVSIEYGKALYEKAGSVNKRFFTIKDGKHEGILDVGGDVYFEEIVQFMNSLP